MQDTPRVNLASLLDAGLISENEKLIWGKSGSTITYRARILPEGRIETSDGKIHNSLSTAASHMNNGIATNGWRVWRLERSDLTLQEVRSTFLMMTKSSN